LGGVVLALIAAFRPALWSASMARANLIGAARLVGLALSIWILRDKTGFIAAAIGFPLLSFSIAALVASAAGPAGLLGCHAVPGAGELAAMAYSLI
jgi:hypothetical protein